jgi:tyrosyl-tRNA synthetase
LHRAEPPCRQPARHHDVAQAAAGRAPLDRLIGGGTTKVGDPSGKDESRKLLSDAEIAANIAGIESVFTKFLSFGGGDSGAVMVNNADWLGSLNYIDFLRDYGRHFSVNRMLTYDSVKLRLEREQPLSFIEFNYMVLQAYDFLELYRRLGCRLQMGGSDQWGNIVSGIELGRRAEGVELFGLTSPLLTTASGAKMGKTASGRGVAQCRHAVLIRLLAVLAEHRGCRRRALPQAVHRAFSR